MLLAPLLDRFFSTTLPKTLRLPLSAAVGAHIVTSPVLVSRFGLLYPVGLLSGLVLTPIVTAFVWGGLAIVFLPVPEIAVGLSAEAISLIHRFLLLCAELFARANPIRFANADSTALVAAVLVLSTRLPRIAGFLRTVRRKRVRAAET
jgi:predicted membrane metal-binding protein